MTAAMLLASTGFQFFYENIIQRFSPNNIHLQGNYFDTFLGLASLLQGKDSIQIPMSQVALLYTKTLSFSFIYKTSLTLFGHNKPETYNTIQS